MELRTMAVADIKIVGFNPPGRTEDGPELGRLRESIKRYGIKRPLEVNRKGELSDGHRRLACAIALDLAEVPVLIVDDTDPFESFLIGNGNTLPLSMPDWLAIYCAGREVPKHKLDDIRALERMVGKDDLRMVADRHVSPRIRQWVGQISRYCGDETVTFRRKVLWWLIDLGQQRVARRAMEDRISPDALERAITGRLPLVMTPAWAPAEVDI